MRTYSRADFLASKEAWSDYGDEWLFYRQMASDRGMLYPPSGSPLDSIDDPLPSQRAIVYRAIGDTPKALTEAIRASHSWSEVVRKLMADVDRRREDVDFTERQVKWDRQDEPDPREATVSIKAILNRIHQS